MILSRHHSSLLSCSVLMAALLTVACSTPPSPRQASFDPQEYAPYAKAGHGTITGQVSLKNVDGAVTSGGGCKEVFLEPVTSYSSEWIERAVMRNETLSAPDSRAITYRRTTSTDGLGNFRFDKLPAGSYYVSCMMQYDRWIMTGQRPTMFLENVWIHSRVDLDHGEHGKVFLAH